MVGVAWELSIIIGWPITGGGVARGPRLTNPGQVVGKQHLSPTNVARDSVGLSLTTNECNLVRLVFTDDNKRIKNTLHTM